MPAVRERLVLVEQEVISMKEQVDRLRDHVSSLLTFQNKTEAYLKVMVFILGFLLTPANAVLIWRTFHVR